MYIITAAIILTILNIALFIFFRQFFPSPIIFYQGIYIFAISALSCLLLLKFSFIKSKWPNASNSSYELALLSFLMSYSFLITVPALLDRSISLYIIGVTSSNSAVTMDDYKKSFYNGFLIANDAIGKRVQEQIVTGNLEEIDGIYRLTNKGKFVNNVNKFLVEVFNTDRRYVNPVSPDNFDK